MNLNNDKSKKNIVTIVISILILIFIVTFVVIQIGPYNKNNKEDIVVDIPTGSTLSQVTDILKENKLIKNKILFKLYVRVSNNTSKLKSGKYLFNQNYSNKDIVKEVLNHMLETFESKYNDKLQKRQKELNKSLYEVIDLASIVEKEAVLDEDRPIIASVFYNRIKIGMPLQSDATIQYIFKERKKSITYNDLKIDSPYNTYKVQGLPPTPIANPGIKSIEAVLYPSTTEYLYFVATIEGGNTYSKTYEEHVKNVEQYRKDREERNNSYSTDK